MYVNGGGGGGAPFSSEGGGHGPPCPPPGDAHDDCVPSLTPEEKQAAGLLKRATSTSPEKCIQLVK